MTRMPGRYRLILAMGAASLAVLVCGQGYAVGQTSEKSTIDLPQSLPANSVSAAESDIPPSVVPADSPSVPSDFQVGVDPELGNVLTRTPSSSRLLTIDYRLKTFLNSNTSNEIGTSPDTSPSWAPLSRLRFPINSVWQGLQVGVERPEFETHFEWLTPIGRGINGNFADFDWADGNNPTQLTDMGYAYERWNEGQSINLDLECKLSDHVLGLPIEIWPIGGFRWQRFNITAYDLFQQLSDGQPDGRHFAGDVITYNQQWYQCYVGGQLRKAIQLNNEREIRLTLQGDWGATWGYNIDHHLITDVPFYARERTQGGSWHIGLTAEVPLNKRLSLGVQGDYMKIHTTGKTWDTRIAEPWTNGVNATSEQTSLTAFGRLSY
jgi:hypothetical protein